MLYCLLHYKDNRFPKELFIEKSYLSKRKVMRLHYLCPKTKEYEHRVRKIQYAEGSERSGFRYVSGWRGRGGNSASRTLCT